jgi:hypothetical protein
VHPSEWRLGSESGVQEMTDETRRLTIVGSAKKRFVTMTFSVSYPWRVRAKFDDGTVLEVTESDLFECLVEIRKQLELEGGLVCCEGARRDVFPSGMARQMGGARHAYRLVPDQLTGTRTLVDIFAATDCQAVATVPDQIESVRRLQHG